MYVRARTFSAMRRIRVVLMAAAGCAPMRTQEGTGQYVDDSVITTKVKAAIPGEPGLKTPVWVGYLRQQVSRQLYRENTP